ncbi:hypothetical protein V2J09_004472 [Rumex salicifolius]
MTWVSNVGRTRSQCDYERSAIQEVVILSEKKTMFSDSCSDGASPARLPRPTTPPLASPSRFGIRKFTKGEEDEDLDLDPVEIELEIMKERFSKLLLGEDMSGSGKGVCTAVTISNAITNLYATIFGNNLRLEPMKPEKKSMWKREMDCFLSFFKETEFSYMEQKSMSRSSSRATSFRKVPSRKDDKWWLPVPWIPSSGLSERSRKHLRHQRDCGNQIHKAAMAINNNVLNEMEVPESYIADLPKSGKTCLGDAIYKHMYNADVFYPEQLLDTIKIASEHEALELADKVEASMYTWRRKAGGMAHSKSWNVMKDLVYEADRNDKNHVLAERAKTLLFCLKHRYPELSQTTLDTCKILHNRDVGQAILESYSRVLEGFAFNLVSWIDDVLDADQSMRSGDDD